MPTDKRISVAGIGVYHPYGGFIDGDLQGFVTLDATEQAELNDLILKFWVKHQQ